MSKASEKMNRELRLIIKEIEKEQIRLARCIKRSSKQVTKEIEKAVIVFDRMTGEFDQVITAHEKTQKFYLKMSKRLYGLIRKSEKDRR